MRCDLHCHSTESDGTETPAEVAARAGSLGLALFALSDHDTVTRIDVPGTRTIRAVEISCDYQGRTIHLLAYDRGGAGWTDLEARLATTREARRNRLRVMAARLAQRGVRIDVEPIIARADGRSVGRPDLARAMVAAGAATSMDDAFARHLYDNGPVDVPHHGLSLRDALALGRAANAAMSLAHPHYYNERAGDLVRRYKMEGMTGLEAFYGSYDSARRRRFVAIADELGVTCTGGSDWHGLEREDLASRMGIDLPSRRADALLRWLEP